jgi:3-deoxy-D-manno-octulosonic-acid transferase
MTPMTSKTPGVPGLPGLHLVLRLWDALACLAFGFASGLAPWLPLSTKVRAFFSERSAQSWRMTLATMDRLLAKSQGKTPVYWFHVASAGELEQAIPLARTLSDTEPCVLIVSYLSPSARPFLKNLPAQERVLTFALHPFSRARVQTILKRMRPSLVFFVRYDLWPAVVDESHRAKIPLVLMAGTQKLVSRGLWSGPAVLLKILLLRHFSAIFALSEGDATFFRGLVGQQRVVVTGDPKWIRAKERAASALPPDSPVVRLRQDVLAARRLGTANNVLAWGSPHNDEWEVLFELLATSKKQRLPLAILAAPHEVDTTNINRLRASLSARGLLDEHTSVRLLSELMAAGAAISQGATGLRLQSTDAMLGEPADSPDLLYERSIWQTTKHQRQTNVPMGDGGLSHDETPRCIVWIVDVMGHLAEVYGLADAAIIGGGFDGQLHNCLEPAARGVPVLFGPNHQRAPEAARLLEAGAAKSFADTGAMFQFLLQCVSVPNSVAFGSPPLDPAMGPDLSEPDSVLARMALCASRLFDTIPQTHTIMRDAVGSLLKPPEGSP